MNKFNDFEEIIQKEGDLSLIFNLQEFEDEDIFRILPNCSDDLKPILIISLKSLDTKEKTETLINLLTGQDGRIREAVSCVLSEFCPDNFLYDEKSLNTLVNAICDINPNVARNIINLIQKSEILKEKIFPFILLKTRKTLEELSIHIKGHFSNNLEKSNKNHAKNKLTFNLYWLLECMSILKCDESIEDILQKTANFLDYTIREKTAVILSKMGNPPKELLHKLKNDENIYVKNQLLC